ncbi:MAG: NAD(P)-dependent oxidoreductase [Bacteroidetes bacterium]|nr:NAD(P)-dependent oxidoreductase [Bacteroidota bacterium]
MNKIILTGATGFIGSHVLNYFRHQGLDPYCIIRNKNNAQIIPEENCLTAGLNNPEALTEVMKGADFLIHIAGLARDWGRRDDFYMTNVEGTLNVMKAAVQNGVKNMIITGSISSYGEENSVKVKNEESPYNSHYPYFLDGIFPCAMNYYRDSKAIATQKAIEFAETHGLNLTVIEPVWVFGEREFNTGFYEYMKTVKDGTPFLFGDRKNKFPVIYAGDLARAYYLAWSAKLSGINRVIIGNTETPLMDELYSAFCTAISRKKPRNLPRFLVYPMGFLMELIATWLRTNEPPLLTRARVNMFYDNVEFDVSKAKELLGFKNDYSLEEAIKKTVTRYRENGYL